MSNDGNRQNQPQTQGPSRAFDQRFEPIKVKSLEFRSELESAISGLRSIDTRRLLAGKHSRIDYLTIEIAFEPWQRMYRVRETNTQDKSVKERCIPENWASYEPAVNG